MSKKQSRVIQVLMMFFGIFMVLFYLGVAVLLAINLFGLPKYLSWFFAAAFGVYGLYRGYREMTGDHSYGMRRYDDDEEEEYMTYSERLKMMEDKDNEDKKK